MSLNIEESNKSVDNYAEIRYNSNIRFLHKNFPPENEVLSEAHRLATWWARREDVSAGDRTLISMKNRWYVVEMFDDAENYYQVEGWIRKADYNKVLEDIKKYGRSDRIKSIQRSTNRIDMFDQSSGSLEGRESSSNRVRVEYREKNKQIQPMDQETPYWRERSASDGNGDSSSSGADKQGSNIKSSISSEISPKKASLTDGVFFDGKDGDSYSLSDAGDGDLAPMGRYDVRGDDVAYVGDDLAPLKPEYSSGGAQYSLSGGPVLDDDLPLSEKYKEDLAPFNFDKAEAEKDGREVEAPGDISTPEKTEQKMTFSERLEAKLQNSKTELENLKKQKEFSRESFDKEIANIHKQKIFKNPLPN